MGRELYHIYYKLSCDIIECKGDLDNAQRYLRQCRSISKELGLKENQVVEMKLGEIDKIRNRRNDEKQVGHAKECIKIGDLYMQNGRVKDALE